MLAARPFTRDRAIHDDEKTGNTGPGLMGSCEVSMECGLTVETDARPVGTEPRIRWTGGRSQVEPMLDGVEIRIRLLSADGTYDGEPTSTAVTKHSPDAAVAIRRVPMRWRVWKTTTPVNGVGIMRPSTPMAG